MNKLSNSRFSTALLLASVFCAGAVVAAPAERGDDSERKSKNGHVEGTIDGVAVTIDYGRPEMRERDIFGALVPFGSVWRTGADEATTITLGSASQIEGQELAAGTYSLFTIPGEDEWTIVFNRTAEQWGAYEYSDLEDALRVTVEPEASDATEVFTIEITEGGVALRWAETRVHFSVAAAE